MSFSTFLYHDPTFLDGVASLLDFGGALDQRNISASPEEADALANRADWLAVGADLRAAVDAFSERHPELSNVKRR